MWTTRLQHRIAQNSALFARTDGTNRCILAFRSHGRVIGPGTAMTRKDFTMDWDQIENKWAAMTRRVRADWSTDRPDPAAKTARRAAKMAAMPLQSGDRQTGIVVDTRVKMSIE